MLAVLAMTVQLDGILDLCRKRFPNIDHNIYHLLKSLVYFDDAECEPMPEMIRAVSWQQIRESITGQVTNYQV